MFERMCTFEESIEATPNPFTEFSIAKGLATVKLGEFVDGS